MEDAMPEELPIACSLSATDFPVRLAQIESLGHDALVSARVDGAHAELRFAAGAGVRDRVERFAEAEGHCCAFLRFGIADAPDEVLLTVDGLRDAAGVVDELVAAFGAGRQVA
jgi:hypothetical protein